jgi:hypothetical protein
MKKIISFLLISSILFSSCASILNGRYQKVGIKTDEGTSMLVNGKKPVMKKGKYVLKRNAEAKEITIFKEGYKDSHYTVIQGNRSPLYILSWIPFAYFVVTPLFDKGEKVFNYDKEYDFSSSMLKLPHRSENGKNIRLNKVSVNLDSESVKSRHFSRYGAFKAGKETREPIPDSSKSIKIENTLFKNHLNSMLVEQGFIDTTNRVLTGNYSNNLYLNATIKGVTVHTIEHNWLPVEAHQNLYFGYVDLEIEWELLDYYKESLNRFTSISTSGQFTGTFLKKSIYDALEIGLIEFLSKEDIKHELSKENENLPEKDRDEIILDRPSNFVENISDVMKASVTIRSEEGHGSGFIISQDGYIITNYHVVSNKEDLQVILYNGYDYKAEVVRVDKKHDLALLKIEENSLSPFKLSANRNIKLATEIYAVGTPSAEDLGQTISAGIVSGIRKTNFGGHLIQTDASINSGNSGGAIVNEQGEVIAVVSSKLVGFGIEGVAFGIPFYEILDQLKIRFE